MKAKRSGCGQDSNQGSKKKKTNSNGVVSTNEIHKEKKEQGECHGVCSISWKPAAVAR